MAHVDTILIARKDWDAILAFFKDIQRGYRDSFGIPGEMEDWETQYEQDDPDGWEFYAPAKEAILRIQKHIDEVPR